PTWRELAERPWVLNPPGCMLRAALLETMARAGAAASIAAEVHNMHMQLAFVAAGYGIGLLPERFIARHAKRAAIRILRPHGFALTMNVAFVRAGQLGSLEAPARQLEADVRALHR